MKKDKVIGKTKSGKNIVFKVDKNFERVANKVFSGKEKEAAALKNLREFKDFSARDHFDAFLALDKIGSKLEEKYKESLENDKLDKKLKREMDKIYEYAGHHYNLHYMKKQQKGDNIENLPKNHQVDLS